MCCVAVQRSDDAEADLERLWLSAARRYGAAHAFRVLSHLDDLFCHLEQFPGMGRQHPKLRPGIRYFPVRIYPFIVFFKQQSDGIRIVRILHDKMQVEDHLS